MIDLQKLRNAEIVFKLDDKNNQWYRAKLSLKKHKDEIDGLMCYLIMENNRTIKSLNNITTASEFLSPEKLSEKNNFNINELYMILYDIFKKSNLHFTKIYIKGRYI